MSAGSSPLYRPGRSLSAATARGLVLIAALLILLALGAAALAAMGMSGQAEGELVAPFRWPPSIGA